MAKQKEDKQKPVDEWEMPNKIEALLFVSGNPMNVEDIKRMIGAKNKEEVEEAIKKVETRLNDNNSSLMVTRLGDSYKINVREKYVPIARKVVSEIELSKSLMETLAVIAWQQPVLQSEVIRVRTNKGYEDVEELINMGFITKEKFGRSFILKVTKKFFEYFDVQGGNDAIRKLFSRLKNVAEREAEEKEVQQSLIEEKKEIPEQPASPTESISEMLEIENLDTTPKVGDTPIPKSPEEELFPKKRKKKEEETQ